MIDSIDDELAVMDERSEPSQGGLSGDDLARPIEQLVSKKAISVDVSRTVADAVALMSEQSYGAICVTRGGKLTGIITERDLLVQIARGNSDLGRVPVTLAMTPNPVALRKHDPILHVAHHMHCGGYRHVPIVDAEDRPVSIVSIKDVMRWVLNFFPREVINAPSEPYRGRAVRDSG